MNKIKKTVLIVDDEPAMVEVLKSFLEHSGYETVVAYEGVRAIEIANKHLPDLILLDVMMPAGNGQTVLESLRRRPQTQKIPVIVLTASQSENLKETMMAKGANAFFHKPYEIDQFLTKIEEMVPLH